MATSRVKTNLFLTFEVATKWQNVCYTQRSYRLISLNQPKSTHPEKKSTKSTPAHQKKKGSHRKKSTKKHYGAFKSTHYDPCYTFTQNIQCPCERYSSMHNSFQWI